MSVLRASGHNVKLWPVRSRVGSDSDVALLNDTDWPSAYAAADLVVVATDTARHVADTIAALDAGAAHVLVEKPLASNLAEAAPLISHPLSKRVTVAAPLRAHAAFRDVVQRIPEMGDHFSAFVRCQSWLPSWRPDRDYRQSYSSRQEEGGVLRDLVHELDYAVTLFGEPELLFAELQYEGPLDVESDQAATLVWRSGRTRVMVRLDYISAPGGRSLEVHGVNGSIEWDVSAATVTLRDAAGGSADYHYPPDLDRNRVMATQHEAILGADGSESRATRLAVGYPATMEEGLAVLDLCDRARQMSAQNTRTAGPGGVRTEHLGKPST